MNILFEHKGGNIFKILTENTNNKLIIYPNFQGSDSFGEEIKGTPLTVNVNDTFGNEPHKDYNYFTTEKKDYIEKMIDSIKKNGWESFSPIKIIHHPLLSGKYLAVDGNHRLAAFKIAQIPKIKAELIPDNKVALATPETKWNENEMPDIIDNWKNNKEINLNKYFTTKDLVIPKSIPVKSEYHTFILSTQYIV